MSQHLIKEKKFSKLCYPGSRSKTMLLPLFSTLTLTNHSPKRRKLLKVDTILYWQYQRQILNHYQNQNLTFETKMQYSSSLFFIIFFLYFTNIFFAFCRVLLAFNQRFLWFCKDYSTMFFCAFLVASNWHSHLSTSSKLLTLIRNQYFRSYLRYIYWR